MGGVHTGAGAGLNRTGNGMCYVTESDGVWFA